MVSESKEYLNTLDGALMLAQSEFPDIPKDQTNTFYNTRYASLDSIVSTTRPALTKYKLVANHRVEDTEDGVRVTAVLKHVPSKEERTNSLSCICNRNDPQKMGSAITYLRRYTFSGLLGITPDEDDDGNAAKPTAESQPKKTSAPPPAKQPPAKAPPASKPATPPDDPAELEKAKLQIRGLPLDKALQIINVAESVELLELAVDGLVGGAVYQTLPEWAQVIAAVRERYGKLTTAADNNRFTDFLQKMKGHAEKWKLDQAAVETFQKEPPAEEASQS